MTLPFSPEGANDHDAWKLATPPEYDDGTGHSRAWGCRVCGSTGEPKRPPAPMVPGTERYACPECGTVNRRSAR